MSELPEGYQAPMIDNEETHTHWRVGLAGAPDDYELMTWHEAKAAAWAHANKQRAIGIRMAAERLRVRDFNKDNPGLEDAEDLEVFAQATEGGWDDGD